VRIATWNCQPGLESQWDAVEGLDADVIAIQEVRPGTKGFVDGHDEWKCEYQEGKFGRGIAVLVRRPYRIRKREPSETFAVSTVIGGSAKFRFVGFWAMTPKAVGYSYHRQATRVIEQLPSDPLPTVVAGDFNASQHPRHLANVKLLRDRGLVSAYHKHRGVAHTDADQEVTAYTGRGGNLGFHIDFVFVPDSWHIRGVEVGTFDGYPGQHRSDHVPVVVTVEDPS
jgi:endonuclease/exonuclease/phosphatase family metal-dependent hydrolase